MTRFGAAVRAHLGLGGMTPGAGRGLLYIVILTVALYGGSYYQSTRAVDSVRHQQVKLAAALEAEHQRTLERCHQDADIGSAPIAVNPATGKASKLGVSIVADARTEWHGIGCPGHLAPPTRSFVHWAKAYKLPYN